MKKPTAYYVFKCLGHIELNLSSLKLHGGQ